jgi:hypothetical protein
MTSHKTCQANLFIPVNFVLQLNRTCTIFCHWVHVCVRVVWKFAQMLGLSVCVCETSVQGLFGCIRIWTIFGFNDLHSPFGCRFCEKISFRAHCEVKRVAKSALCWKKALQVFFLYRPSFPWSSHIHWSNAARTSLHDFWAVFCELIAGQIFGRIALCF